MQKDKSVGFWGRIIQNIGGAEVSKASAKLASPKKGELPGLAQVERATYQSLKSSAQRLLTGEDPRHIAVYTKFHTLISDRNLKPSDEDLVIETIRRAARREKVPFNEQYWRNTFRSVMDFRAKGVQMSSAPLIPHTIPGIDALIKRDVAQEKAREWTNKTISFVRAATESLDQKKIPTWSDIEKTVLASAKKHGIDIRKSDLDKIKRFYDFQIAARARRLSKEILTRSAGSSWYYSPYESGKTTEEIEETNRLYTGPISSAVNAVLAAANAIEAGAWAVLFGVRHRLSEREREAFQATAESVEKLHYYLQLGLMFSVVGLPLKFAIDVPLSLISGYFRFMSQKPKESFFQEVYKVGSQGAVSVLSEYDVPFATKAAGFAADILAPTIPLAKYGAVAKVGGKIAVKAVRVIPGVDALANKVAERVVEGKGTVPHYVRWATAGMGVGKHGKAKRTTQDILYNAQKEVMKRKQEVAEKTKKVKIAVDRAASRKVTGAAPGETPVETPVWDAIQASLQATKQLAERIAQRGVGIPIPTQPEGVWMKAAAKAAGLTDVAIRRTAAAVGKASEYGAEIASALREAKVGRQEVTGPLWYEGKFRRERARISRGISEAIDESLEATLAQQRDAIYAPARKTGVPLDKAVMVRKAEGEADTPFVTVSGFTAKDRRAFAEYTGARVPFDEYIAARRRADRENLFKGAEAARKRFGTDPMGLMRAFEAKSLKYIDLLDQSSYTSRVSFIRESLPKLAQRSTAKNINEAAETLRDIDSIMRDVLRADLQNQRMTIREREELFGIWSALRNKLSRRKAVSAKYLSEGGEEIINDIAQAAQQNAEKANPVKSIMNMFQPSGDRYEFTGYDIGGIRATFTKAELKQIENDLTAIMSEAKNAAEERRAARVALSYLHSKVGSRFAEHATEKMRAQQRANALEAIGKKLTEMDVSPHDVAMITKAVEDVLKNEEKMGMELFELGIIKNLTHVLGAHVRLRYAFYQNPDEFIKNMQALASTMDSKELRQGFARMSELRRAIERARLDHQPTDALERELNDLKRRMKVAAGGNPYVVPMIDAEVPPYALEEAANIARSTMEFYIPGSTAPAVVKKALGYERKRISRQHALKMGREMGFELRASRGLEQVESIEMRRGFDRIHDEFKNAGMVLNEYKPGFSYVVDAPEVYGKLAGKWIPDGAWFAVSELVNEMRAGVLKRMRKEVGAGKFEAAMENLYLWFKLSKTAYDPRTQIVNIISNVVALNYQAHGLHPTNMGVYARALLELIKGKGRYIEAYRRYYPAGLSSMMAAELGIDLEKFENVNWTGLKGAVQDFLMRNVKNRAIKAWEFTEEWSKLAGFIYLLEKGVPEFEAAVRATNAIFDYARTPALLKTITKSPWGVPFISFPYHYTRRLAESLWSSPRRIRNLIFVMTNTPKMWMDPDTLSVIENTMHAQPSYQAEQKIPVKVEIERIRNAPPVPSVKTLPKYPFMPLYGMVGERFGLPMPFIGGTSLEKYEPVLRSVSPWFMQILNVFSGRRATGAVAARPELMETMGVTTPPEKPTVYEEAWAFLKNLAKEMGPVPTGIASGTFWWPLRSAFNLGMPFYTEWGQAVGPFGAMAAWMGLRPIEIGTKEWLRYRAAFQEKKRALESKAKSISSRLWKAYDNYMDLKEKGRNPDIAKFIKPSDLNSVYKLAVYAYVLEQKYEKAGTAITAFLVKRQRVSVPPPDKIELTPKEIAIAIERADKDFITAVRNLRLREGELWRLQSKLSGRPRELLARITGVDQEGE